MIEEINTIVNSDIANFTSMLNFESIDYIIEELEKQKVEIQKALNDELINCSTRTYYGCETSKNGLYFEFISTSKYDNLQEEIEKLEKKLSIAYEFVTLY